MAINFPTPTSNGQIHTENGTRWQWNGTSWTRVVSAGNQGFQGDQGAQGNQGAVGNQGNQGAPGNQGNQGATGNQGNQGATGNQGDPGATGNQGNQGAAGVDGNFGGATFDYTFDTDTTDSDPGQGTLRFNNATLSSATQMFIDDTDDGANNIEAFLRTIDDSTSTVKGHVRVSNRTNAADFALFTISGTNTEATGYHKVSVSYVSGATSFSDGEDIIVTFARTGTKGDQGAQGNQGAPGSGGLQGAQGNQGAPGTDGNQGAQGASFNRTESNFTATSGQTTFSVTYANGDDLDVFINGVRLTPDEYTATNGTSVVLDVGATAGDIVDILYFESAGPQGAQGNQGATGNQGNQGATGNQGNQGSSGSATITNNADNRVITGGSGTNLNGEANLTFDGSTLTVTGDIDVTGTVKTSAVPGTNTNAGLPVLFQTSSGVIDGGSSLTFNPATDTLTVNGLDIGSTLVRASGDGPLLLSTDNNSSNIDFRVGVSSCISKGNLVPLTDNTYELGNAALRWANIYSADLQLSNEGSTNDVDGTWGKYTIQEGENDLFLINRRTGKKYKFMLEEVN